MLPLILFPIQPCINKKSDITTIQNQLQFSLSFSVLLHCSILFDQQEVLIWRGTFTKVYFLIIILIYYQYSLPFKFEITNIFCFICIIFIALYNPYKSLLLFSPPVRIGSVSFATISPSGRSPFIINHSFSFVGNSKFLNSELFKICCAGIVS